MFLPFSVASLSYLLLLLLLPLFSLRFLHSKHIPFCLFHSVYLIIAMALARVSFFRELGIDNFGVFYIYFCFSAGVSYLFGIWSRVVF